jgi:alpha-D-xyloside xylohydrolase
MKSSSILTRCGLRALALVPATVLSLTSGHALAQQLGNYDSYDTAGRSIVVTGASGERIRVTPYGDYIARVQFAKNAEDFYADDRYDMVESHDWDGTLGVTESDSSLELETAADDGIIVSIDKQPLRLSFSLKPDGQPLLMEQDGVSWSGNTVSESFELAADEHFAGLGHPAYGQIEKLDRRGTSLKVSHGDEGAAIVPFYVSSKGYGVFLNTTFTHTVNLGQGNNYGVSIDGEGYGGQMDYFFIGGPLLTQVIDRYTQLTGRPRLPQRSLFGLLLSDKSDPDNNGEQWWKQMITDHRNAGFAFDHQVNDNAWRASNEATSGQMNSWFAFRADRYPDPAEYKRWADENGVTVTLDLNRPGIPLNPSWKSEYEIPGATGGPDFTNPAVVAWIWDLFWNNALDPALGYPGDAIWLDEFDYPDYSHSTTLASGKRWAEESINYHLDLIEACVKTGWDPNIGEAKRPYFWSRGTTAGAQRYGAYWTGDLDSNWSDMAYQVKAMQSAGISGFPYFNHDAGGHFNVTVNEDNLYRQWDMAFGSFTPIWKPHGPGHKRWPLQRNATCQATAKTYITDRYEMLPYIYSYAHIAQQTGMPMARAMFLEDQDNDAAWQHDMQYYWGHEMLVAPNCSDGNNTVSVWLPAGNWYGFWDDSLHPGDTTLDVDAPTGDIPVFVREGSIIPMAPYALSTFFIPQDQLVIHAYTGDDGAFTLYEDDGVSERFRTKGELRTTQLRYVDQDLVLEVGAAQGTYADAPSNRSYQIVYHGLSEAPDMYLNGDPIPSAASADAIADGQNGAVWDANTGLLTVYVGSRTVDESFWVASANSVTIPDDGAAGMPGTGGTPGAGGMPAAGGATAMGGTSAATGGTSGTNPPTAGGAGNVTPAAGGSSAAGSAATGGPSGTVAVPTPGGTTTTPGNVPATPGTAATPGSGGAGTFGAGGSVTAFGGAGSGSPTSSDANGGCGCRVLSSSRPSSAGLFALVLGLGLLGRRRRRALGRA